MSSMTLLIALEFAETGQNAATRKRKADALLDGENGQVERVPFLTDDIKNELWAIIFNTDQKPFKAKKMSFAHMIRTDGVSCSVLLKMKEQPNDRQADFTAGGKKKKGKQPVEKYIDEISWNEDDPSKTIVGIDPNMGNLLYCSTEDGQCTFRYTQNQREHETKSKRFGYIRWKEKRSHIEDGKNIEEWESTLSNYDHKTVNFVKFKAYVKQKTGGEFESKGLLREANFSEAEIKYVLQHTTIGAEINQQFRKDRWKCGERHYRNW